MFYIDAYIHVCIHDMKGEAKLSRGTMGPTEKREGRNTDKVYYICSNKYPYELILCTRINVNKESGGRQWT